MGLRLPNPNADKANAQTGKSLEMLLVAKNKRIQEELTKFRVSAILHTTTHIDVWLQILHGELEASLAAAQAQLATTETELEKQRMLNEKLENDLLQMDQRKPNGDAGSDSPQLGSLDGLAGIELGKKTVSTYRCSTVHDELECL